MVRWWLGSERRRGMSEWFIGYGSAEQAPRQPASSSSSTLASPANNAMNLTKGGWC
jgi:hypothetical protein